jgi:hypothetical protein
VNGWFAVAYAYPYPWLPFSNPVDCGLGYLDTFLDESPFFGNAVIKKSPTRIKDRQKAGSAQGWGPEERHSAVFLIATAADL